MKDVSGESRAVARAVRSSFDGDHPTILVCDPIKPRRTVLLTESEFQLVNMIRNDKGIGPVMVLARKNDDRTAQPAASPSPETKE